MQKEKKGGSFNEKWWFLISSHRNEDCERMWNNGKFNVIEWKIEWEEFEMVGKDKLALVYDESS